MRYALNLNEDGRILSVTFEKYATNSMPLVDALPEGNVSDYLYRNGEYVQSPLPKPPGSDDEVSANDVLAVLLGGVTE